MEVSMNFFEFFFNSCDKTKNVSDEVVRRKKSFDGNVFI